MKALTKFYNKAQTNPEFGRFIRFAVVGLSGTLLDLIILTALKFFFHWPTLPANIVSYSCGIINNYLLNCFWVYPEARVNNSLTRLAQFILVSLSGLILNNVLVLALEAPLGKLIASSANAYLPAKILATGVVLVWNFLINRLWTFGKITRQPSHS